MECERLFKIMMEIRTDSKKKKRRRRSKRGKRKRKKRMVAT